MQILAPKENWKLEIVQLNISSTFNVKNRCKFCKGSPKSYHVVYLSPYYYDVRAINWIFDWYKKYIKRMSNDWYLKSSPKHFRQLKHFNYYPYTKYNPAIHQHVNMEAIQHVMEYLGCPCGKTTWLFNEKDGMERPEIKHRKGRYKYPHKFEGL